MPLIGIIGGDKRMLYVGSEFEADGCPVLYFGFDNELNIKSSDIDNIEKCNYLILPIPPTRDCVNINTPLSNKPLVINDRLAKLLSNKIIFCTMPDKLKSCGEKWNNLNYIDYGSDEAFTVKNAVLTADATVEIIKKFYTCNLSGVPVLVLGFGRVGKACCEALKACDAEIYAGARKTEDFTEIEKRGFFIRNSVEIKDLQKYKIIINTVPAMLLDKQQLCRISKDAVIIDLASGKGGTNFDEAKMLGITAVQELGLPGRYYPQKAGKIIKNTIHKLITA